MKNFYFLFLILPCLFSCSREEILPLQESNLGVSHLHPIEDESGIFIDLNIDGAFNVTTRDNNITYEEAENTVVNGKIFVFEGSPEGEESKARCITSANLFPYEEIDVTDAESLLLSKKLHCRNIELKNFDYDASKDYYALVTLNTNDGFEPPLRDDLFGPWAATPQKSNMLLDVKSFPDYSSLPLHYKYITMTNATGQVRHNEGDFLPSTLVKIDKGDIKRGKFDTNHQSNTIIYVQRNVASVTVQPKINEVSGKAELASNEKLVNIGESVVQMNLNTFFLDIINTTSYPVQNIVGLDWSNVHMHSGNTTFDQIYWAVDPNYDDLTKSKASGDFSNSIAPVSNGMGSPMYCLENTFDIDNMLQAQTTRAIIRARMEWWGNDAKSSKNEEIKLPEGYLYDANGENNTTSRNRVTGNNFDEYGFFTIGKDETATLWDFMHLQGKLQDKCLEIFEKECLVNLQRELAEGAKAANPAFRLGGKYLLKDLVEITDAEGNIISPSPDQLVILGNALGLPDALRDKISFYIQGYVYYVVRIRHFYDEEGVGWDGEYTLRERDGEKIARYEERHLGRYGVVRNTQYLITVKSIKGLGEPEQFPDFTPDDTDDMPNDYLLDLSVSIKPWGKRKNSFDL